MRNCELCGRSEPEHSIAEQEGVVHHPFTGPGQSLKHLGGEVKGKKERTGTMNGSSPLPTDPVLRFVLISKGIITGDDLTEMEKSLLSTGVIRTHGDNRG